MLSLELWLLYALCRALNNLANIGVDGLVALLGCFRLFLLDNDAGGEDDLEVQRYLTEDL